MTERNIFNKVLHISRAMTRPTMNFSRRLLSASVNADPKDVPTFKTLSVSSPKPFVYHVELNRPSNLNAMNNTMWLEIGECFEILGRNEDCRIVLLSGSGRVFTAGLDFNGMALIGSKLAEHEDVARRCKILKEMITKYQDSISSLEKCDKPVLCLIHSACIGGGVDLITAADIRYCTEDAVFQVKEVDIGMAADVGTLQRLPRVIGSTSLVNELCLSARKFDAAEAKSCGLVNRVFKDKQMMMDEAMKFAETVAGKSPVAVQGTKRSIVFSRDHSIQEGLNHIAEWNQTALQSEDFLNASVAQATKSPAPPFAKL